MSLKEKFEQARSLIEAQKYTEARKILRQINHPKATEWLNKLDQLDPPVDFPDISVYPAPPTITHRSTQSQKVPEKSSKGCLASFLGTLIVIAFMAMVVYLLINNTGSNEYLDDSASSVNAAKLWLEAIAKSDNAEVARLTCSKDLNQLSNALFQTDLIGDFVESYIGVDVEREADVSDANFMVVESVNDVEIVQISGKIRITVANQTNEMIMDDQLALIFEDNRWKVCPSSLQVVATSTPVDVAVNHIKLENFSFYASDQGDGWVVGQLRTTLQNSSSEPIRFNGSDLLAAMEGAYVETQQGVQYEVRISLGAESHYNIYLPSNYRFTCSGFHIYSPIFTFRFAKSATVSRIVFPNRPNLDFPVVYEPIYLSEIRSASVFGNKEFCASFDIKNPIGGPTKSDWIDNVKPLKSILDKDLSVSANAQVMVSRIVAVPENVWGDRKGISFYIYANVTNLNQYENTETGSIPIKVVLLTSYGEYIADTINLKTTLGPGQSQLIKPYAYFVLNSKDMPLYYAIVFWPGGYEVYASQ